MCLLGALRCFSPNPAPTQAHDCCCVNFHSIKSLSVEVSDFGQESELFKCASKSK